MNNQETEWNVSEIVEHLSNTDEIIKFLHENSIAKVAVVESTERYEAGENRQGIILKVQETGKDSVSGVMIDIREGQPSTDQVYDAIYGIGKDCTKRAIVFTDARNENDRGNPAADEYAVGNVIKAMGAYQLNLYFIKLKGNLFQPELYNMEIFKNPKQQYSLKDLPSPERFCAEEFWSIYLDFYNEAFYKGWEVFNGGIHEISEWGYMLYIDADYFADFPAYWDNNGIRLVIQESHETDDQIKKIWMLKKDDLEKRFPGCVELEYLSDKLTKIVIKYSDRPISWLLTATSQEKIAFAKIFYKGFWELRWLLEGQLEEMRNLKIA